MANIRRSATVLVRHKWSGCWDAEWLAHIEPPHSSDWYTDDTEAEILGVRLRTFATCGQENSPVGSEAA